MLRTRTLTHATLLTTAVLAVGCIDTEPARPAFSRQPAPWFDDTRTNLSSQAGAADAPLNLSQVVAPPLPAERPSPTPPKPKPDPRDSPAPSAGSYAEAQAAYRAGRYEEAARHFADYSELHPEEGWGYYMLGVSSWKAGLNDVARSAFRRTLELDPKHTKSLFNLSRVLIEDERAEEALARLRTALEVDPGSNVAYRLLGEAYESLGRLDEASSSYRRAIELHERDVWAMSGLARVRIQEGRHQDALPPLGRAIELNPGVAAFHADLGTALEGIEQYRSARRAYRQAIAIDGENELATAGLARLEGRSEEIIHPLVDVRELARHFLDETWRWERERARELEAAKAGRAPADTGPTAVPTVHQPTASQGSTSGEGTDAG